MVAPVGYVRCDSCGKRKKVDTLTLVAYRAASSRHGPWLAERLCVGCLRWYQSVGYWTTRLLEPSERSIRGIVYGQRSLV